MTLVDRAVVVLQVRMSSRRLPGKALEPIAGRPVIAHCVERLQAADIGPVIVATTTDRHDDTLARVAAALGVTVVRGPVDDVLGRFAVVLKSFPARVVVRATADNPAVDSLAPRRVQRWLDVADADYVVEAGLPYGAAVEAVRAEVLLEANRVARDPADREHVTTWVARQADRFRVLRVPAPRGLRRPDLRFTVDTSADLQYMRRVITAAGGRDRVVALAKLIDAADGVCVSKEVA